MKVFGFLGIVQNVTKKNVKKLSLKIPYVSKFNLILIQNLCRYTKPLLSTITYLKKLAKSHFYINKVQKIISLISCFFCIITSINLILKQSFSSLREV